MRDHVSFCWTSVDIPQADAFPGGLRLSADIDREVVKDDPEEWGLLATYSKNGKYLMTAYRMAGLCFASHVDQEHAE